MLGCGAQEHARLWLSAFALVRRVVVTGVDAIKGQVIHQIAIDLLNHLPRLCSAGYIRLIGNDQQLEMMFAKEQERFFDARENLDLRKVRRWAGNFITNEGVDEHSITVEKDAATYRGNCAHARLDAPRKRGG